MIGALLAGFDLTRWLSWGIAILSLVGAVWFHGYFSGKEKLHDYKAQQAAEAVRVVKLRAASTDRIVTRYIKVKGDTQTITNTIEKEVIRYVETNPGSCLDRRWRWLHDAAAANRVPDTSGKPDGAGEAPTAAEALETVTENYADHHACVDRLDSLQAWVREQQEVR